MNHGQEVLGPGHQGPRKGVRAMIRGGKGAFAKNIHWRLSRFAVGGQSEPRERLCLSLCAWNFGDPFCLLANCVLNCLPRSISHPSQSIGWLAPVLLVPSPIVLFVCPVQFLWLPSFAHVKAHVSVCLGSGYRWGIMTKQTRLNLPEMAEKTKSDKLHTTRHDAGISNQQLGK